MFGFSYVLIGISVYLTLAIGHFLYFLNGVDREYPPTFGQYILLAIVGLFWPIAHVAYWIHLIRTR